jgi:hypothetical protein
MAGEPVTNQRIIRGDCLDVFRDVRGLQAIVTDPPAGIGFMGRGWDKDRGGREKWIAYWAERFAVAKDACEENAVGLFWALPRTSHWTATAVEDAGWRIRDVITHHFGQGWPKDRNALKPASEHWILAVKGKPALGIDACRVERGGEPRAGHGGAAAGVARGEFTQVYQPGDHLAHVRTDGSWPTNTLLSHAETCERVGMRKVRGANHTGSNPSEYARLGLVYRDGGVRAPTTFVSPNGTESVPAYLCAVGCDCGTPWLAESGGAAPRCACGRDAWWACPVAEMDVQSGDRTSGARAEGVRKGLGYGGADGDGGPAIEASSGGASRFFPRFGYHAKAPSGERHAGCEELLWRVDKRDPFGFARVSREEFGALDPKDRAEGNVHPTVKRLSLMRWLHRLTGAKKVGDLCGGSGSGAVAAYLDGIDWIGAEVSPQAIEIAEARLAFWRGLSFEARERFLAEDVVPRGIESDERQGSLFS